MLVQRLRSGDAEGGYRFVREYYPRIFHYLLYLTGRREAAEDLTQETFLQAWRRLETFDDRLALGPWLHQIARREFLQEVRRRPREASLEAVAEVAALQTGPGTDEVELRAILGKLPRQQREIVVLHHLEGYTSEEVARIVGVPAGTVRYRLSEARGRLRAELGEGDLLYLNELSMPMRQWNWLPLGQMHVLATRLTPGGVGRWALGVGIDGRTPSPQRPTPIAGSEATTEDEMERREFLRQAAVGAAGLMLAEPEKEVVDSRLTQNVTCAFKGTALSDVCGKLQADTGVRLAAGPSVADEKVTLFCQKLPMREVMRQLSRPFGYTWLRSRQGLGVGSGELGKDGRTPAPNSPLPTPVYRYELVQDLRSQLLEEELRNRDAHAALLVLQAEIERYRPFLGLSPDEALKRASTHEVGTRRSDAGGAPAAEKPLLAKLAGFGHGPIRMFFQLSPQDLAALRAGEELTFSDEPKPGERRLPPEIARAVLQTFRDWRVVRRDDGQLIFGPIDLVGRNGIPATESADARAAVTLKLEQSELGTLTLSGSSICFGAGEHGKFWRSMMGDSQCAVGRSPEAMKPENGRLNRRLGADPRFAAPVTVHPKPITRCAGTRRAAPDENPVDSGASEPKVTTADVLEALYRATGRPIVADFYTRLFLPAEVSVRDLRLEAALNQLSDAMRFRWNKDDEWLQFRSASFYNDRIKEVPNRLLSRWSASRQKNGALALDDLIEIAELTEAQLDSASMAEGARQCWGLREWELASNRGARPHLRFLAGFTPQQRQAAMSPAGLAFAKMPLAQQQRFLALATLTESEPLQSLTELDGAVLLVDYSLPGWFQWGDPELYGVWPSWVVPVVPGPQGRRVLRPIIRERTREAAVAAVRRLDPQIREAAGQTARETFSLTAGAGGRAPLEAQVFPSKLRLTFVYMPGSSNARRVRISSGTMTNYQLTW
jgi:RNA polymerase sigma-70 factor (ECF subfamily)